MRTLFAPGRLAFSNRLTVHPRIARNARNFETWSAYQNCEEASFSDIPDEFTSDVQEIFNTHNRISKAWLDKVLRLSTLPQRGSYLPHCVQKQYGSEGFAGFLKLAFDTSSHLFSSNPKTQDEELMEELSVVFLAWKRLRKMRASNERWSEADYVASVYVPPSHYCNPRRANDAMISAIMSFGVLPLGTVSLGQGFQQSISSCLGLTLTRVQCTVSLPQAPSIVVNDAHRVQNTKTAIPDCAVFLPTTLTRPLSQSAKSPYKVLKNLPAIAKAGTAARGSSFRYQSTPCARLPDMPGFEFVSSFWEDKKPVHTFLDDAYRQNRIATASGARHLHSLNVRSPVIGLIWANGRVRAHIDWCEVVDGKLVGCSERLDGLNIEVICLDCRIGSLFAPWASRRLSV